MNANEFASVFDTEVIQPLSVAGFKSSGKSAFLISRFGCLSLIRLGGRLGTAGGISHVLCYRHTFLRTLDETTPRGFVSEVFAYPYKLRFADFAPTSEPPKYRPKNLDYDYDRFEFADVPQAKVRSGLRDLRSLILDRAVPWARGISPRRAADEIRQYGEAAWIERLWIQDYSKRLRDEPQNA